jgi:hypothetical protein
MLGTTQKFHREACAGYIGLLDAKNVRGYTDLKASFVGSLGFVSNDVVRSVA